MGFHEKLNGNCKTPDLESKLCRDISRSWREGIFVFLLWSDIIKDINFNFAHFA